MRIVHIKHLFDVLKHLLKNFMKVFKKLYILFTDNRWLIMKPTCMGLVALNTRHQSVKIFRWMSDLMGYYSFVIEIYKKLRTSHYIIYFNENWMNKVYFMWHIFICSILIFHKPTVDTMFTIKTLTIVNREKMTIFLR